MLLKEEISKAFQSQNSDRRSAPPLFEREYFKQFSVTGSHVEVISGVRRCGKSSLMQMLESRYQKPACFNFEDSRVYGFDVADFSKLDEAMGAEADAYFFDEIQNVPGWEVFVRQLHDRRKKIYLTGSNAALLSKELGTRLTGRHIRHELFPFSFAEFAEFKSLGKNADTYNEYLTKGGFPEFLLTESQDLLQNLLMDIVLRDIAVRYGIRNTHTLVQLCLYLMSNIGKEISYNSLRKTLNIASPTTVSDYLNWFDDSYLLFYLPRFSWSTRQQIAAQRKVYAIDTGLANANSLSHSADVGRLFENSLYLHFRRAVHDLYFYREQHECDFIVMENGKCQLAMQCCLHLNSDNLQRELKGLMEAMEAFNLETGYIVTLNQHDLLTQNGKKIVVLPAYEFVGKEDWN